MCLSVYACEGGVCVCVWGAPWLWKLLIISPLSFFLKQASKPWMLSRKHTLEGERVCLDYECAWVPPCAREREVAPHQKCASKRLPSCHVLLSHAWGSSSLAIEWVKLTNVAHVAQFNLTCLANVLVKLREASLNCRHGDPLRQVSIRELSQACRLKTTEPR